MCMISKTAKADAVRDYYVKMEEILMDHMHDVIQESKTESNNAETKPSPRCNTKPLYFPTGAMDEAFARLRRFLSAAAARDASVEARPRPSW